MDSSTFEIRVTTVDGESATYHVKATDTADAIRKTMQDVRSDYTDTPTESPAETDTVISAVVVMDTLETDATLVT